MQNSKIRELILETIKEDGNKKIPPGIIVKKITNKNPLIRKNLIFNVIDEMLIKNELKQTYDNKVVLGYIDAEVDMSEIFEGTITINSHYDGFISLVNENGEIIEEFYVNKIHTNGALRNDRVKFALLKKEKTLQGLREASVIEIIERKKTTLVAEVIIDNESYSVIPDDNRFYLDIEIKNLHGINSHDKVLLNIEQFLNNKVITSIIRVIGNKNNLGVDIESITLENGVPIDFEENALLESENLKFEITKKDQILRKDIRNRKIITIDPATSKDLDDAIYVEKLDNGNYFLSVSIADVSSYVKPNTHLNDSALNRGTSVYLINKVIPMLPLNISDNLCSLNENEDKMTLTCDTTISSTGEIISINVYPTIMMNHKRLSYDEVNEIFDNKIIESNDYDKEILNQLWIGYELHNILRKKKYELGYIEFDIKEPYIKLDEKTGIPIEIGYKKSGIAQKMIEDFMVICNEAVTLFAEKNKLPFIYRTHDRPDNKKINMFLIECKKLGFNSNADYLNLTSKDFLNLLECNKEHTQFKLFNKLLLKSMQKAKYTTDNIGHFGLAIKNYTHFTSPIRRYSDLIIHRIFWMFLFDKESYTDKQRIELISELDSITKQCNLCEIRQIDTERTVNSTKFAEYMSYRIGEEYEGIVSAIVSYGMFVELDNMIEGLVSLKNMNDDFYTYNEQTMTLIGRSNHKIYTLGSKVKIKVISASKTERKIDFKIIG